MRKLDDVLASITGFSIEKTDVPDVIVFSSAKTYDLSLASLRKQLTPLGIEVRVTGQSYAGIAFRLRAQLYGVGLAK